MTTVAMTVLSFDAAGARRVVEHMTAATDWSRGFGDTSKPRPQILFGLYPMSNGKPRDMVDSERSFVVYAEGYDPEARKRSLDVMRWGLVPFWAKDIKVGFANINAKAEGSRLGRPTAGRSSVGAASFRSTTSTNGRRPRLGSNPMRSHWPTGT
jgi:putative SOS response-associated peptidase YedK